MKISLHLQIGMMYNYFNVLAFTILLCSSTIYIYNIYIYNGSGSEPE